MFVRGLDALTESPTAAHLRIGPAQPRRIVPEPDMSPTRGDSAANTSKPRDNANRPPKAPHRRTWRAIRGNVRALRC